MRIVLRVYTFPYLLLLLFAAGNSYGESAVDSLERQLEMGRHKQLVVNKLQKQGELTVFTTDGCSGGLSVGWEYLATHISQFQTIHGDLPPWQSCCVTHDLVYHKAGGRTADAEESFALRREADRALQSCVAATGTDRLPELSLQYHLSAREVVLLYTGIANLMYRAVRIGGMPCTGLPWRWGYGWAGCE